MSNTGQALMNSRELQNRGDMRGAAFWSDKAIRHIAQDMIMPRHFEYRIDEGQLLVACDRCQESCRPATLASAARFRDRHFYCGERTIGVRICPACHCLGFEFQERCRFCWHEGVREGHIQEATVGRMLAQKAEYVVTLHGEEIARIICGSRRQAEAAAEAMLPLVGVVVMRA